MSPGIRDQLLLLIDDVERITVEVFEAVQQGNQAENLLQMLITKDRELAKLLTVAQAQKELHARIEHYKEEVAQLNSKITEFQKKLISASSILDPALHRAKDRERMAAISQAEARQIKDEDIVKYSHKISACHATCAPTGWAPGDSRRPFPTDIDMRAGILPTITNNGQINHHSNTENPPERPPAQLGTDGLAALIKGNPNIGNTWRASGRGGEAEPRLRSPPPHGGLPSSPTQTSSSSSDSEGSD